MHWLLRKRLSGRLRRGWAIGDVLVDDCSKVIDIYIFEDGAVQLTHDFAVMM